MTSTIDRRETDKFAAMAGDAWDPAGSFRPLHEMNPVRLDYVCRQIGFATGRDLRSSRPFDGLRILDIGCGVGLMSEPMARMGAQVTGIDAAPQTLDAARGHAETQDLKIDYRIATAEDLSSGAERFDAVIAMEVVEHVTSIDTFLRASSDLVVPGGLVIASTLNRTAKSFGLAILGAEWILGWLPRGTHDWRRFVTPDELSSELIRVGLEPVDRSGFVYDPLSRRWSISQTDLSVNYAVTAIRS